MRPTLMLLLGAAALGCHGSSGEAAASGASHTRVPVGVATVALDSITEQASVVGRLVPVPGGSALLSAPAAGVVRTVHVQVGSPVKAGEPLVDLDVPELIANAHQLRAEADLADRDAQRQRELFKEGITSQRQADEKTAAALTARVAAEAAEQLLARATVRSPISGGVQRVMAHIGERVDAGAPLVEVINRNSLDLIGAVPAAQLARLKVGQAASVTAEGSSETRPGIVQAIAPAVDSLTNSGQAVVRIPAAGQSMRAGAGATASITLGTRRGVLVVPDSALVLLGDTMHVFVVGSDSLAHARPVRVGVRQGRRAEVTGDLKPGDRVATTGAYGLEDGMKVVADTMVPVAREKP